MPGPITYYHRPMHMPGDPTTCGICGLKMGSTMLHVGEDDKATRELPDGVRTHRVENTVAAGENGQTVRELLAELGELVRKGVPLDAKVRWTRNAATLIELRWEARVATGARLDPSAFDVMPAGILDTDPEHLA